MSWLDAFATPSAPSGGATVGTAKGRIVIDTASLAQSRSVVVRESRLMGDALKTNIGDGARAAAKEARASLDDVKRSLDAVHVSANLALTGLVGGGILAANSIKRLNASFVLLAGSQQSAKTHMDDLRKLAKDTGQSFLDMQQSAVAFLPAVRQNNLELGKTVLLAQRLLLKDPTAFAFDATKAISELMEGQYTSLERRFGIIDEGIKSAVRAGDISGALDALDEYLNRLDITTEAMKKQASTGVNAQRILRDEFTQTIGLAFDPATTAINKTLLAFSGLIREARQLDPELLKVAGTLATIYSLSALPTTASKLPVVGGMLAGSPRFAAASSGLAKAGVYGAALYGGAQLGGLAVRGLGEIGVGEYKGASQSDVMQGVQDTLKQVVVMVASVFTQFAATLKEDAMRWGNAWGVLLARINLGTAHIGNALAGLVEAVAEAAASLLDTIAGFLESIDKIDLGRGIKITTGLGAGADSLRDLADDLRGLDEDIRTSDATMQRWRATIAAGTSITEDQREEMDRFRQSGREMVISLGESLGVIDKAVPRVGFFTSAIQTMANAIYESAQRVKARDLVINEDVLAAWSDFKDKQAELTRKTNEAILDEETRYAEQRGQLVEDYTRQLARMAEDEAIQNQRRLDEQERRIGETQARTAQREAELRVKLHEDLAQLDAKYNDQMATLEENNREAAEKAAEEHIKRLEAIETTKRRTLLQAARRLDAIAVWDALQAAKEQRKTEDDNYDKAEAERKKALEQQRQDYQSAYAQQRQDRLQDYQKQLSETRANGAAQIQEMRVQFEREQRLRDEDRARQLARMNEDHQRSLAQMQSQHQQRLAKIAQDANTEAFQLEQAFIKTFNTLQAAAGAHESVMLGIQRTGQAQMESELRAWWERQRSMIASTQVVSSAASSIGSSFSSFLGTAASTISGAAGKVVQDSTGEGYYTYNAGGGMTWTRYPTRYATGGDVLSTGIYGLERDERVLTPSTARSLRRMLGSNYSEPALVGAVAGGGQPSRGGVSVNGPWYISASDAREAAQQAFDMVFDAVNRARRATA